MLTLEQEIANLTVGQGVTLTDVCKSKDGECVMQSITQYYQNEAAKLDAVVMDEYGFFVMADYLSHFLACAEYVHVY